MPRHQTRTGPAAEIPIFPFPGPTGIPPHIHPSPHPLWSQRKVGCLTWLPPNKYVAITFKCLTPYSAVARTTAKCYYHALRESELRLGLGSIAEKFESSCRAFCSDSDAALAREERAVEASSSDNASAIFLRTFCNVHRISTIREESCDLDNDCVTKMRQLVLTLRAAGGKRAFRQAVRETILSHLHIVRDRRPNEARDS